MLLTEAGYPHPLYEQAAEKWDWRCVRFELPNHAAGGTTERVVTECVWNNC